MPDDETCTQIHESEVTSQHNINGVELGKFVCGGPEQNPYELFALPLASVLFDPFNK